MSEMQNGRKAQWIKLDRSDAMYGGDIYYEDGFFHVKIGHEMTSYNVRYVREVIWVPEPYDDGQGGAG